MLQGRKIMLPVPEIEPYFLKRPVCSLVTVLCKLFQVSLCHVKLKCNHQIYKEGGRCMHSITVVVHTLNVI